MNRKRVLKILASVAAVLLIVFVAALVVPLPPHGRFTNPQVGNSADAYWEANDGKLTLVAFSGDKNREGEETRTHWGTYRKENGRWMMDISASNKVELKATLLSLRMIQGSGVELGPFYRYEIHKGR